MILAPCARSHTPGTEPTVPLATTGDLVGRAGAERSAVGYSLTAFSTTNFRSPATSSLLPNRRRSLTW